MISRKLTAVLVAVGVVASTSAMLGEINIKGAFADTIKQNVVYTKEDNTSNTNYWEVTEAEKQVYKQKFFDNLKKYFNISINENENFEFVTSISNEKVNEKQSLEMQKKAQDSYDNKKISKEEYDKEIASIKKGDSDLKDNMKILKHGTVSAIGFVGDKVYEVDFNENTKEVDSILISEGSVKESDVSLKLNEDQLRKTAEDFIKQNKLGDIEKPKFILKDNGNLYYQDENDASKKACINFDIYTGNLEGFSIKEEADLVYTIATK